MEHWRELRSVENHEWCLSEISEENPDFIMGVYDESDLTVSMHSHDFIQIYYIQDGMMMHEVDGKVDCLSRGDVFLVTPGVQHRAGLLDESKVRFFSIGFYPRFVDFSPEGATFLSEFLRFVLFEHTIRDELAVKPRISFSDETFTLVNHLINDMLREHKSRMPGYLHYLKGQLIRLLVLVAREYTATPYYTNGKTAAKIYSDAILKSIRYVDGNFTSDLKIEDMTRKFLLSRTYFCDLFKKFTGCTFNEYISNLRINHAKQLLGTSDMSITEVAIASGFNDISNLCRQFARQLNVSPTEYRKMVTHGPGHVAS